MNAVRRAGFSVEFSPEVEAQVREIAHGAGAMPPGADDLRALPWSSIDNDSSRDLDQVECAAEAGGGVRVRIGIADVSQAVAKGTPIDEHAAQQTATIYTTARIFPMLPVALSTNLTSLAEGETRAAVVVEFTVAPDGGVNDACVHEAVLVNRAQLAYGRAGTWLATGDANADAKIASMPEMQTQLRLQDRTAQWLKANRLSRGALEFERPDADPVLVDGTVELVRAAAANRATDLIEELMIAANEVVARALRDGGRSSLRRVVRSPERWARIVELAKAHGAALPTEPSSAALSKFLLAQRAADPVHYPDLSSTLR